jgi:hypothetical protein
MRIGRADTDLCVALSTRDTSLCGSGIAFGEWKSSGEREMGIKKVSPENRTDLRCVIQHI